METQYEKMGTGANVSEIDSRTVKHSDVSEAIAPLVTGGIDYLPSDIENQHAVGICTAISRVQMREKQTGRKYSPDFQYLLQKKFFDGNWIEGSSVLTAMKVAKNYGFLPLDQFTYVTEADRSLPYSVYIAKLQNISDSEVQRLIGLCVDKIIGYASVDVTDPQAIAKAIVQSPQGAGILCRYGCQKNWWESVTGVVSWAAKDINPLRPAPETSGHAIINSKFDYTNGSMQRLANTWSAFWCLNGSADIDWDNYKMNEAWVDLSIAPIINHRPLVRLGSKGMAVSDLQTELNAKNGSQLVVDGDFGIHTQTQVIVFQKTHGLVADGIVGALTWAKLDSVTDIPVASPKVGAEISGGGSSSVPSTITTIEKDAMIAYNFMNQLILSSTGSGEISMTLKGLGVLLIPILIQIASQHGITITQDNVMQAIANVTTIVGQVVLCIGLIRKFYNWIKLLLTPSSK